MFEYLGNLSVRTKLATIILLGLLGLGVGMITASLELRAQLMNERQLLTRNLVQAAHGLLTHYYQESQRGGLTQDQAQTAALEAIKALRYQDQGYFWINDFTPRVLMHPTKPDIQGKDMSHTRDSEGQYHWREFAKVAREQGEGFVSYHFRPNSSVPSEPKISYVKGFTPWGWVVGTGIYVSDVDAIFHRELLKQGGLFLVTLTVMGGIGALLARSVVSSLGLLVTTMERVEHEHDLRLHTDMHHKDEIGRTGQAFDAMLSQIARFVEEVKQVSQDLFAKANDLSGTSQSSYSRLEVQQQDTQQVATAMTQMVAAAQEVARAAADAAVTTEQAREKTSQGDGLLQNTMASVQLVSNHVGDVSKLVTQLNNETGHIAGVLDVIRSIAEQTNLLALNAAIEAARAGDKGRGFAVVADEVRALARRTQDSTREIDDMVSNLQGAAQSLVGATEQVNNEVHSGLESAASSGQSLTEILQAITHISEINHQVATAAEQQSAVAAEIDRSIDNIGKVNVDVVGLANGVRAVSSDTSQLAEQLAKLAGQYRA